MKKRLVLLTALMVGAIAAGPVQATGTHGQALAPVIGQGAGIVNVTPTANAGGFSAQITVNVHGTAPNTTFIVQRAPEVGRPNPDDGICQRANEPNSAGFISFNPTLVTDANGNGTVHFAFAAPAVADGTRFDVQFRLIDSLAAPATDLRTGCFTVTVK